MNNPLAANYSDSENTVLVSKSLNGDVKALDALIRIHQPFIYNVAWKMTNDKNDALDLTQEALIKVVTKLNLFKGKSAFRTWLYRIVVNEFLQAKRKSKEDQFLDFNDFSKKLDGIPESQPTPQEELELKEFTREAKMRCMSGMLMCLSREQRLIYVLGDLFGIDQNVGSEIFNVSKNNYRALLSRARKELHNFMQNKCGLVNVENPCRCAKKAKGLRDKGLLKEGEFRFTDEFSSQISDYVGASYEATSELLDRKYVEFYREHPTKKDFDANTVISEIMKDKDLKIFFH
ncbi:MAG: RNA polymerase sigma factor [Flavobacteriales bacterium]|nr:RNA polymerase sigma factor [Flavobacteriales bacterium]